jgi:hypothetical protein
MNAELYDTLDNEYNDARRAESMPQVDADPLPEHAPPVIESHHYCTQCGRDMGFEYFLGVVCGKCCRANHKKVCRR